MYMDNFAAQGALELLMISDAHLPEVQGPSSRSLSTTRTPYIFITLLQHNVLTYLIPLVLFFPLLFPSHFNNL